MKKIIIIFGLLIFGLLLALAWEHGQIRGLDEQLQAANRAIIELRADNARLSNKLNELVQISFELHLMPLTNLTAKERLGVADIIRSKAAQNPKIGLTAGLILAVIRIESAGDKRVVSKAYCVGLMQLMPSTAAVILGRLGFDVNSNINDLLMIPTVNVVCGIEELVRLRKLHRGQGIDSWHVTLMTYLCGQNMPYLAYSRNVIQQREEMRKRGVI